VKHSLFLGSLDYYDPMEHQSLLSNIGLAFTIATLCAFIAKLLKQPVILAYLVAGVVIGPEIGFAWVKDKETIDLISEIGLILLLFIIGLEIDLKKLLSAGRTILVAGVSQFLLCVALGIGLAFLMGYAAGKGNFDWIYLAVTLALSSTLIVVKLLYDKFELTTLPGRITPRCSRISGHLGDCFSCAAAKPARSPDRNPFGILHERCCTGFDNAGSEPVCAAAVFLRSGPIQLIWRYMLLWAINASGSMNVS